MNKLVYRFQSFSSIWAKCRVYVKTVFPTKYLVRAEISIKEMGNSKEVLDGYCCELGLSSLSFFMHF